MKMTWLQSFWRFTDAEVVSISTSLPLSLNLSTAASPSPSLWTKRISITQDSKFSRKNFTFHRMRGRSQNIRSYLPFSVQIWWVKPASHFSLADGPMINTPMQTSSQYGASQGRTLVISWYRLAPESECFYSSCTFHRC